jgi:ABC-type Na+ efflux pump permease subunit
MANPSLKAQIEAAKSALASDLAAPSLVTPPRKPTTTPATVHNDVAIDTGETDAAANSGYAANHIPADGKSAHATNASALDKRITRLETKLLDNQRDLHTLLQKIREISRLQVNSGQSHKKLANDDAETMVIDEAKDEAVAHRSQRSPVIMVAMVVLIGLGAGITYLLATGEGDPSALKVPRWISTIIDHFNRWIG